MKKYNPKNEVECPKCGAQDIRIEYHDNHYDCSRAYYKNLADLNAKMWDVPHLHMTCPNCGYQWPEEPLNLGEPA